MQTGPLSEEAALEDLTVEPELTLDPQNWSSLRELGHRMLDDMFAYLETVRTRPAWQPVSERARKHFSDPVPINPEGAEVVYRDFKESVLPYPTGVHPRFWAWVHGSGSAGGMLAEMLAGAMNSSAHGSETAPVYVELQVLSWLKQALGYPAEASGLLVGGGSMANFVGLAVARDAKADWAVKEDGLSGRPPLVFYGSSETHSSVRKAVELLGLGSRGLRYIEVDDQFRIRVDVLQKAIAEDRKAGKIPICVIGNAGTVNTGATDDLVALSHFCRTQHLWFHVDGAFGATAAISPKLAPMLRGMERADSLAFDLHKWMHMPYDVGCALVRWPEKHRSTFGYEADYLKSTGRGLSGGPIAFSQHGLELSRGFRALKVWFCLKQYGLRKYQALVEQNAAQAKYLGELVNSDPRMELLAPISLNIVCFRFVGKVRDEIRDEDRLNALNQEILLRLQESGMAAPSSTRVRGKFAIRVAITNHRSRREDFEILVREAALLGEELAREGF
jgi:aromatic-L-amino-acid/L-tryptophan decarboxylase